jgi:hypothetical protein
MKPRDALSDFISVNNGKKSWKVDEFVNKRRLVLVQSVFTFRWFFMKFSGRQITHLTNK